MPTAPGSAREQDFRVFVGTAAFDPLAMAGNGEPATATGAPQLTIVQFAQRLTPPDVGRLRDAYGLRLDQYIPNLAYLERVSSRTLEELRLDFLVRAAIAVDPEVKLAPSTAGPEPMGDALTATLFHDADPGTVESVLDAVGARDVRVLDDRAIGGHVRVRFSLDDPARLREVADVPDVVWIEEVTPIDLNDVASAATTQSGSAANTPMWDRGLHGEGQRIGVIDAGPPDMRHCFFVDVPNSPAPSHRKVHFLRNLSLLPDGNPIPPDDHATFVAGVAAGDERGKSGQHPDRGGAWAAKLVCGTTVDVAAGDLLHELVSAMKAGAIVHNNSWQVRPNVHGSPARYDAMAHDVDSFTWQNEDQLVLGSGGFRNGHLSSPATAKNAICVNAARADPDEMDFGDGNAGPTADGRRKPDLMAVGCGIRSATIGTPCATNAQDCATSAATPNASAAAALVRQYFTEGWYPTGEKRTRDAIKPTGALLKAVLLNSTVDMTGIPGYPSDVEGWGLIRLDRALHFGDARRRLRVWDVRHVGGPDFVDLPTHDFSVDQADEQLRVTLVWTDAPPAALVFAAPVVNDLDLKAISPDGTTYVGNDFTGGVSTRNGRSTDALNNVEMVVVDSPAVGPWRVEIQGFIPVTKLGHGQGYALAVTAHLRR